MPSKKDLEKELEAAKQEIAKLKRQHTTRMDNGFEFEVGEVVKLCEGQATIHDFYAEDGIDKVRVILNRWQPADNTTPSGQEHLCSFPKSLLPGKIYDYEKDQLDRDRLQKASERLGKRFEQVQRGHKIIQVNA